MGENLSLTRPNGTVFVIDMAELRHLTARQSLAAGAGRMEALALMEDMKEGYRLSGEARATVGLELDRAKTAQKTRKAVICLDLVPDMLKAKGLASARNPAGSAEQRDDALNRDTEYLAWSDYIAQLDAQYALFGVKMETFRMTYSTVKRNFDDQLPGMVGRNYNGGAWQDFKQGTGRPQQSQPPAREESLPPAGAGPGAWTQDTSPEIAEDYGIIIGKARYT